VTVRGPNGVHTSRGRYGLADKSDEPAKDGEDGSEKKEIVRDNRSEIETLIASGWHDREEEREREEGE
jgi:hypothetical protein